MPNESNGNAPPLEYIFHPRSIAVVGISADLPKLWIKRLYLKSLLKYKYPGQIYLVNPKGGEMDGLPLYRSVKDIPGPVDHVVISVPAAHTPQIMEECRDVGAKVVHVFFYVQNQRRAARPGRQASSLLS